MRSITYTIAVSARNLDLDYLHLIDNLTGADIDLLLTPVYSFNANSDDYPCRFRLVYGNGGNDDDDSFAFISNGQIVVSGADANATIQVVDALGRIAVSRSANANLSTDNLAPGVYVLRLLNGADVRTQKIVVE